MSLVMPKVSVIIPSYNCSRYLNDSIKSVLSQSYKDLELIVVDDGSTDGTEKVVGAYLNDQRVKYVRKAQRSGLSTARNTGIERSGGELVAFLDADDIFLPHKLSRQAELFRRNERCDVSYTNEAYFEEGSNKEVLSNRYRFQGDLFFYLKRTNFIHISTVMVRRNALGQYRFDEDAEVMGHGDWELLLKLAFKGMSFCYINQPLSRIRVWPGCMTKDTEGMDKSRRAVGMLAKAYWKEFRNSMRPFSLEGEKAILRYVKMKTGAFLIGFPRRKCFNKPTPQELLRSAPRI